MPWESSGISEIARVTNCTLSVMTHGLMIRLAKRSVGCVCYTYSALRYDLMGIIPRRGFPYDCFLLYASGWLLMPSRFIFCRSSTVRLTSLLCFAYYTPLRGQAD